MLLSKINCNIIKNLLVAKLYYQNKVNLDSINVFICGPFIVMKNLKLS